MQSARDGIVSIEAIAAGGGLGETEQALGLSQEAISTS